MERVCRDAEFSFAMPFEEWAVARASGFAVSPGETLTTCSAEDLVVHEDDDATAPKLRSILG